MSKARTLRYSFKHSLTKQKAPSQNGAQSFYKNHYSVPAGFPLLYPEVIKSYLRNPDVKGSYNKKHSFLFRYGSLKSKVLFCVGVSRQRLLNNRAKDENPAGTESPLLVARLYHFLFLYSSQSKSETGLAKCVSGSTDTITRPFSCLGFLKLK